MVLRCSSRRRVARPDDRPRRYRLRTFAFGRPVEDSVTVDPCAPNIVVKENILNNEPNS